MRSGACTVQQTLTAEAASILKHSLSLARRRGHAQVTPLHVAATLLSSRTSLLRRACLKSQPNQSSHPLQCRALELCFNVALNRLPTTPGPLLHGQPSLSNALIAALKRAQAHQRRGCIEQQQQQPLLSIKVELEQLIISILDDPSVSRVMREAGFSSTSIKNNIEDSATSAVFQYSNGGVFSSPSSPGENYSTRDPFNVHHTLNPNSFWQNHFLSYEKNPILFSPPKKLSLFNEDVNLVVEVFSRKTKKNVIIVGDTISLTDNLVSEIMSRVERGDQVPIELKQIQFIKFQFAPFALRFMKKEDVEMNITQLKRKVDHCVDDCGGVIVYTGDLKWTIEDNLSNGEYSPIDHLVAEIGKLMSDYSFLNKRVWLLATSNYQTYMRCQMRQPPLEFQWSLQAVSVSSGGLGLSLHGSSVHDTRTSFTQPMETKPFINNGKEEQDKLTCCAECTSSYEKEAEHLKAGQQKNLPAWLNPQGTNNKDQLIELRKKWNEICQGLHHQGRNVQNNVSSGSNLHVSSYPSWWPSQKSVVQDSNSICFAESPLKPNLSSSFVPKFRRQQSCSVIDFKFGDGTEKHHPNLDSLKKSEGKDVKITLALGNSCSADTGKSDLSKLLKENVPWQSEIIDSLVQVLIGWKSNRNGTWLLVEGNDSVGKRRLALSIAEYFPGSAESLMFINLKNRDSENGSYSDKIIKALSNQEKLVVLVEDIDFADPSFLKFLSDGFENEKFGESGNIGQAIFILTKGNEAMEHQDSVIRMSLQVKETKPGSLDGKRKSEWEIPSKSKITRIEENEEIDSGIQKKKCVSRQSSFNNLDLNVTANEEEEENSRDLMSFDPVKPSGFLETIKNRFVFNRNDHQNREITEALSRKMTSCIEEVIGGKNGNIGFSVEDRVIEGIVNGLFVNSVFEKWLKDIFQKTVQTIKIGGEEGKIGIKIRVCFEGKSDKVLEDGFMGTCLPKKIQVSFMD